MAAPEDKTPEDKAFWDAINAARVGPLGRLNHSEIEAVLVDLKAQGWVLTKVKD